MWHTSLNIQPAAFTVLLSTNDFVSELSGIRHAALVWYLVCDTVYSIADWVPSA